MKITKDERAARIARLKAIKDEDIDFSDIPEITDFSKFRPAHEVFPDLFRPVKKSATIRFDADILAWFKANTPKYQTAMNAALREYISRHSKR